MPNLMKAFDVKDEKVSVKPVKDYDIFKDKELLDSLRNTIISNLIDDKVPNNKLLHEYMNDEIDKATRKVNAILEAQKCMVERIEEVYLNNPEEEIHELLIDNKDFKNSELNV